VSLLAAAVLVERLLHLLHRQKRDNLAISVWNPKLRTAVWTRFFHFQKHYREQWHCHE